MRALAVIVLLASITLPVIGDSGPIPLQQRVDALAQQIEFRYPKFTSDYRSRRESVQATLESWNTVASADRGPSELDRQRLEAWLDAAIGSVMPGGSGVLPARPDFVGRPPVELVAQPEPEPIPEPAREFRFLPVTPPAPEPPEASEPVVAATATTEPPVPAAPEPEPTPAPAIEPPSVQAAAPSPAPPVAKAVPQVSRPEAPSSPRPAEPRRVAKPVVVAPPSPARSNWSRHPAAAPLEWRDPFQDDTGASPNPLRPAERREARRPAFRPTTVAINLPALKAEVRGYNAAVRELQLLVMRLENDDVFALIDAAEQLDRLDEKRQFLDLYRLGLGNEQRKLLPDSPSAELVRELVRRKATTLSQQTPSGEGVRWQAIQDLNDRLTIN